MATYNGTAQDDVIDGRQVAGASDWIDAQDGNDRVTLGPNQVFVSSRGDDVVTGTDGRGGYGLWFATERPTVNLREGWAFDGMGGRDQLSAIDTVHMTGLGGTVVGSAANETVFLLGGNNTIDLGAGHDIVRYHERQSGDYLVTAVDGALEVRHLRLGTLDVLTGVEEVVFIDRSYNAAYLTSTIKADLQYTAYSFRETTLVPAYTYAGVTYPAALLSWLPQAGSQLDLNGDGRSDVVLPMNKGYATGLDTRTPFIALSIDADGKLAFDAALNAAMPVTAGARRADTLTLADGRTAVVTVAHDTHDGKLADLTLLAEGPGANDATSLVPTLPLALPGRPHTVDAHAMATGDLNDDGRDDILVGDWRGAGSYALLQGADGRFTIDRQAAYTAITYDWPLANPNAGEGQNVLVDLAIVDVNGDGFGDLISGHGHGSTQSYVFLNEGGRFDVARRIALPESAYGIDNQMHMKTLAADFDGDGHVDLAILRSRFEPFYGGNYLQILRNDGSGHFSDVTATQVDRPFLDKDGARLEWTDYWQLADINGDGAIDILGHRAIGAPVPLAYVNDGAGRFNVVEIASSGGGKPVSWGDFDSDGKFEYLAFNSFWEDSSGSASVNAFQVYELGAPLGTGPSLANSATLGAAAYNEAYYLNEHADVRAMVESGQYASGLAHYLAVGQSDGRMAIAPGVTVQGGAGADRIVLREGAETARGGDGSDWLEGRGGDDLLDGGAGLDHAVYSGARAGYKVARAEGGFTVLDASGRDGRDTLRDIERLQFADGMLALDVDGVAGQAYRIYQAAFAREPDEAGLGYWIAMMDGGTTLTGVAAGFVASAEFIARYGANPSNRELVEKFYLNVLQRPGDAEGITYWVNALDSRSASVADVLMGFSESPENQAALVGVTENGIAFHTFGG